MTLNDFGKILEQAENVIIENKDPITALIYLHKVLDLVESAADFAQISASDNDKRIVLANIKHEAHERRGQVLGFIQQIVSGKEQEL